MEVESLEGLKTRATELTESESRIRAKNNGCIDERYLGPRNQMVNRTDRPGVTVSTNNRPIQTP